MSQFCALILTTCLVVLAIGNPIKDGEDVAIDELVRNRPTVFGQKHYPYMVYIKTDVKKLLKTDSYICGGVIVGKKAVLTAAHCVHGTKRARIYVHAGIVHTVLEANKGQKIKVVNSLAHPDFSLPCENEKTGKCCLTENDIGIVWLEKEFVFGPTVSRAKLATNHMKPFHKEGWILGWGLNSLGELPKMLQRGRVKVASEEECNKFNPRYTISDKMVCVKAANGHTRAQPGDSGGPLVIDEVVYGLSSITFIQKRCVSRAMDLYTFIPAYSKWIHQTLQNGPPRKK